MLGWVRLGPSKRARSAGLLFPRRYGTIWYDVICDGIIEDIFCATECIGLSTSVPYHTIRITVSTQDINCTEVYCTVLLSRVGNELDDVFHSSKLFKPSNLVSLENRRRLLNLLF